jgi:Tfp pilus assembly pilus retraction ATPase PilT
MDFSTMWLYPDKALTRVKGKRSLETINVPNGLYNEIKEFGKDKISFKYKINNEPCRIETVNSVNGTSYVIRKLMHNLMPLLELGMPAKIVERLMEPKLNGLVIFAGLQGVGKTTCGSSLLLERIKKYGGSAQVLEDPPELDLDGIYNNGVIQQIDVHERNYSNIRVNEELGYYASRALRADTDIVYLGEVLRSSEAKEVVTHSGNGALIITTIHASSVSMAIERLINLAGKNSEFMLSTTLSAIIYLTVKTLDSGKRFMHISPLFCDSPTVRIAIKEMNFNAVENYAQSQANSILTGS